MYYIVVIGIKFGESARQRIENYNSNDNNNTSVVDADTDVFGAVCVVL